MIRENCLAKEWAPSAEKRAKKAAKIAPALNSFEAVAREWYEIKSPDWVASNSTKVLSRLDSYLFPYLGQRPVNDIKAAELLPMLRKIEGSGKIETAHRVKQLVSQIMRYAIVTSRAESDPAALTGALKSPNKKHFAAIPPPRKPAS